MSDRPFNLLLRSLKPAAYERVVRHLKLRELHAKDVLYHPGQAIHAIYFPETAVICQMTLMSNGATLETATVGFEGASWISAAVGAPSMPCETIVAISGEAHTLAISDLDREMHENEHFRHVLTQYSHALLIHSMRMTGCTGLHSLEQRCARWILSTLDRVSEDRFAITHEFLAALLGASRPAVSTMVKDFVNRGMLRTERGQVLLGDRRALQAVACECYAIIRDNYDEVGTERKNSRRSDG